MADPSAQETLPQASDVDALREAALDSLRHILRAYGLEEDEPGGSEGTDRDYRINMIDGDHALTLDIDADQELRGRLIGRGSTGVAHIEAVLIRALCCRLHLERDQRFARAVYVSVNGARPNTRRENSDEERPAGQRPVVTIIISPGVEVRTRVGNE